MSRPSLLGSSLLLGLGLGLLSDAEAANVPKIKNIRIRQTTEGGTGSYLVVQTPDADAEVASVAAELDGVSVSFAESDAWVHGSAALDTEPTDGAEITLTLYDTTSTAIGSFAGSYTDGSLRLTNTDRGDGGDCGARTGCGDDETSTTTSLDLEVLAAMVYADGTVGIDLAGADALSVAYADLGVFETTSTDACVATDRNGDCIQYGTTAELTVAELDLDELGILWESEAVDLAGVAQVKIKAYDEAGDKLDKAKLDLGPAWADEGEGVNTLPVDEDPLTTLALHEWQAYDGTCQELSDGRCGTLFTIVSDGWTLDDALPEVAEVAIEAGETWTIPAHSYQLTNTVELAVGLDLDTLSGVEVDGTALVAGNGDGNKKRYINKTLSLTVFEDDEGTAWAALSTWAASPDELPTGVILTLTDSLGELDADVAFDDEVAVVFAIEASVSTDPTGLDLVGKVKLQGEANKKGKRDTLSKGKFAGQFGVDGDGEPALIGIDKDSTTVSRGDILIGGEPIGIEKESAGTLELPPAIVYEANGVGTRNVANAHTTKPGLL